MVEPRFYTAMTAVQFCHDLPSLSPIGEMVSLLVWDQGAQVRFLHRRPLLEAWQSPADCVSLEN